MFERRDILVPREDWSRFPDDVSMANSYLWESHARDCDAGRCKCAMPKLTGCPGFRASVAVETGKQVLRTGMCHRHRIWWGEEKPRIQAEKERAKRA